MLVLSSVEILLGSGLRNIEISTGSVEVEDLLILKKYQNDYQCSFRLHNFFPNLTGQNFALNIGSTDEGIALLSIDLIKQAIIWSAELESDYYAFHAPFLVDPNPESLGGNLTVAETLANRSLVLSLTRDRVFELKEFASAYGVQLAVENNVINQANLDNYSGQNPFSMCASDVIDCLKEIDLTLLLDVAHLKVSCKTLKFDKVKIIRKLLPYISGYHYSDNDGTTDSNMRFDQDAWFMKELQVKSNVRHTVEVYDTPTEIAKCVRILEKQIL
jgi:sugar phosphate isomerase/epimerase